jgi:hypothetical protein
MLTYNPTTKKLVRSKQEIKKEQQAKELELARNLSRDGKISKKTIKLIKK